MDMQKNLQSCLFISSALLFLGVSLIGCSSVGIRNASGNSVDDVYSTFINGDARLTCETSCSGAWGSSRRAQKAFHDNELWRDLAFSVAKVGFQSDQSYYYLGRAAEGLGHTEAARIYYKLALTRVHKCDGGWINNCDGFVFPRDVNTRLLTIEDAINKKSAIKNEQDKAEKEKMDTLKKPEINYPGNSEIKYPENITNDAEKKTDKNLAKASAPNSARGSKINSNQTQDKNKPKNKTTKTSPNNLAQKGNKAKQEEENKKQNEANKIETEPTQKPTPIRVRSVLEL